MWSCILEQAQHTQPEREGSKMEEGAHVYLMLSWLPKKGEGDAV